MTRHRPSSTVELCRLAFAALAAALPRPALAALALALPLPALAAQAGAPGPPVEVIAAVHVHSTASTGELTLQGLVELGRRQGVDAIVLAENLALHFRYAPWPLRGLLEARYGLPALVDHGIQRHLREVLEVQAGNPDVLLLPGVEVVPHYYWSGSPWDGDLTLHDMQRNVLVLVDPRRLAGGESGVAATAELLEELPATTNPGSWSWGARSLPAPLLGLCLLTWGIALLRRRPRRQAPRELQHRPRAPASGEPRWRPQAAREPRRRAPKSRRPRWRPLARRLAAMTLCLAGGALLVWSFPYTVPPYDAYSDVGVLPYERLFDYAQAGDALGFWSMPEAIDDRQVRAGPVTARLSTARYPEALERTAGYAGFGGVYADTVSGLDAGAWWDRLLLAFARGDRRRPPWVIGETAFHYSGQAGKHLGDVVSVVRVDERTPGALFDALGSGRSYALRTDRGPGLRLARFEVRSPAAGGRAAAMREALEVETGGVAASGETLDVEPGGVAASGETLEIEAGGEIVLDLALASTVDAAVPVEVRLVRQGILHRTWEGTTPLRRRLVETLPAGERLVYYRLVVDGPRPLRLVTNPLFVRQR